MLICLCSVVSVLWISVLCLVGLGLMLFCVVRMLVLLLWKLL